jgi:hypothetical protein
MKILQTRRGITEIRNLLNYLSDKDAFICGGYVRYCASPLKNPVEATDVDVYCKDEETFEVLKKHFANVGLEIRYENHMALTYKAMKDDGIYSYHPPIQLIKPVKEGAIVANGDMGSILENFDFTVIRCGLINADNAMVDDDFEEDEKNKFLRIKNIHCPISSTLRFMKYARKGYFTRPMQVVKLFLDWDGRTPEYRAKLIEGLNTSASGKEMTREEIDELEALLRID